MSEEKARRYISIRMLREEIRQDMQDLLLLLPPFPMGIKSKTPIEENIKTSTIAHITDFYCKRDDYFESYLINQINKNIKKLKELVEQNNE